jgi:twitching motility protein PilT
MNEYDNELSKIVAELNRAAPSQKYAAARTGQATPSLDQLLHSAAGRGASDVLLIAGAPAMLRVTGNLTPGAGAVLEAEDVRSLVLPLLEPSQLEELQKRKSVDLSFMRENLGRFRVNIHHQRGTLAASIRLLPSRIPSLESLHLPLSLAKLAERRQGLVLVTGPTGCGKSSTLAALIDIVNTKRAAHVVTIEDPVEYQHANRSAIVEQIEVGRDTPDFAVTLRSIMRQTPDVILVGEMRDSETIATALTAAETGHLVFSTLHTNDTIQSAADPAADVAGDVGGSGAATGAGSGRGEPMAGGGDHDRHRRGARPDPQGRRPSVALTDFRGAGGRDDYDGAIAGGSGESGTNHAGDGVRTRVPYGRFAALSGLVVAVLMVRYTSARTTR